MRLAASNDPRGIFTASTGVAVAAGLIGVKREPIALVIGQDLEHVEDGTFGIVRKVARDGVFSTVDSDARRGDKCTKDDFDVDLNADTATCPGTPRGPVVHQSA